MQGDELQTLGPGFRRDDGEGIRTFA